MTEPISLEQRRADFVVAARVAGEASAVWLEAKAGGRMTVEIDGDLDEALRRLRAARRRIERTERRLERRSSGGLTDERPAATT